MIFRSSAATDIGGRVSNEDAFLDRPELGLWVVADGVGGHADGAVASGAVVAALACIPSALSAGEALAQIRLRLAAVHAALSARASTTGHLTASTAVVLVARSGYFAYLWAGDSRLYRLRGGVLEQITRDHSLVQDMLDAGRITQAESERHPQANVITRAIGDGCETLRLDKAVGRLLPGDRFLLCSDGLYKALPVGEMARWLGGNAAARLLAMALARGAADNATVVAVQLVDAG